MKHHRTAYLVGAFVLCLLNLSVSVLAQSGPEPADPSTTPLEWYTSVGGVGIATIFLVSAAKRAFGTVAGLKDLPTWLYAVVIAFGLTAFCVYVLGTLPGEFWQLAWQAVYNAAIATGIYEWVENRGTTLEISAIDASR